MDNEYDMVDIAIVTTSILDIMCLVFIFACCLYSLIAPANEPYYNQGSYQNNNITISNVTELQNIVKENKLSGRDVRIVKVIKDCPKCNCSIDYDKFKSVVKDEQIDDAPWDPEINECSHKIGKFEDSDMYPKFNDEKSIIEMH